MKKNKNKVIRVYRSLSKPSRVYMSIFCLIFKYIIMFINNSFTIQTKIESNLTKLNRAKFASDWTHFTTLHGTNVNDVVA
jgi:hypothetical protein